MLRILISFSLVALLTGFVVYDAAAAGYGGGAKFQPGYYARGLALAGNATGNPGVGTGSTGTFTRQDKLLGVGSNIFTGPNGENWQHFSAGIRAGKCLANPMCVADQAREKARARAKAAYRAAHPLPPEPAIYYPPSF